VTQTTSSVIERVSAFFHPGALLMMATNSLI
jgi:hypothetical protein